MKDECKNNISQQPEYTGLKYKTRGNASPQGRPRVYFCCYEKDFQRLFGPVTDEILEVQKNAAFWYYDPAEGIPEGEQFLADLNQMQLFVLPVTAGFLYHDNPARSVEFRYAMEHHIPVLPLMQESGLDQSFNEICGDLQFLDKAAESTDPTVLPYEEKLKKYLDSVLVSDELAQKIRAAFDAYVFLSYRKKDRAYAQKIMRMIHENDFCRDIAIWYDEFLTPGENFNDAISEALNKSTLFALVVTPSLLEIPNYIRTEEYPKAKGAGKPVIPIEALSTDSEELARLYEGIDPALPPQQLAERLREVLLGIALRENDSDPAHNFLIGLAYLSGIDVEVDHKRALALITSAAKADLPEAFEKLVSMYQNGEGVARDYSTALDWQEIYVGHLENKAINEPTEENLTRLFNVLKDCGDAERTEGKHRAAGISYRDMEKYARQMQDLGYKDAMQNLALSYNRQGVLNTEIGLYSEALECYRRALPIDEEIAAKSRTLQTRRRLFVDYNLLAVANNIVGKDADALELFRKGLSISKELAEETGTVQARRDLSFSYRRLGLFSESKDDYQEALDLYMKALSIREELAEETGEVSDRSNLLSSYNDLGDICKADGKFEDAAVWYRKALAIGEKISEETGTVRSSRDLVDCYNRFGNLNRARGDLAEASEWFKKSYDVNTELQRRTSGLTDKRSLSYSCSRLGDICRSEGNLSDAREWYLKELWTIRDVAEDTGSAEDRRKLASAYSEVGSIDEEKENYYSAVCGRQDAVSIYRELSDKNKLIEELRKIASLYLKLIQHYTSPSIQLNYTGPLLEVLKELNSITGEQRYKEAAATIEKVATELKKGI